MKKKKRKWGWVFLGTLVMLIGAILWQGYDHFLLGMMGFVLSGILFSKGTPEKENSK
jgi:hypothetical protein